MCSLKIDGVTAVFAALFYLEIGIMVLLCPVPKSKVLTCINSSEDIIGCCHDGAVAVDGIETTGKRNAVSQETNEAMDQSRRIYNDLHDDQGRTNCQKGDGTSPAKTSRVAVLSA